MTVGQKIKSRREELGISQDELAKKCGYKSRSSINKIEMSRDLPLKKVKVMAAALDLSVSFLMGWDEESAKNQLIDAYIKGQDNKPLNDEEQKMINIIRGLDEEQKKQFQIMWLFFLSQLDDKQH